MKKLLVLLSSLLTFLSCRQDTIIWPTEQDKVDPAAVADSVVGFYLLNEGNMGSNKCTLDYYDYTTGYYTRNIYGNANPDVVKELGDVGNDLQIYGSKLWAVVNCSNKIEVMNVSDCKRICQIDIPNCRYIAFSGRYAYVTSYAGPVQIDSDYKQKGYVAKIDTATLEILSTCIVGYQPDQLAILDGKIYVANSGGYMVPNYENTLSVIDMETMTEERRIEVAINLLGAVADSYGSLWVSSRGDYYNVPSMLYCVDPKTDLVESIASGISTMTLCGDSLYVIGNDFSYITYQNTASYKIVNVRTHEIVSNGFITDGTDSRIATPYGIAVNPQTHEIYVTDAKNYVNPGIIYCFTPDGRLKWSHYTGDIPAHFAFRWK